MMWGEHSYLILLIFLLNIFMYIVFCILYSNPKVLSPFSLPPHPNLHPYNLAGKEDTSSIPGSERSSGEGIGYPFQYSWASLVVLLVKNLPAM